MNANPSPQRQDEWDESTELFAPTARDLPVGRHEFHRERLMAQIHDMQQEERTATAGAAGPAKVRRLRLPRPAIALPALAAALAGVVVAGVAMSGGGGVEDGGIATGPALTTRLGTTTTDGMPELIDEISLAAADVSHPVVKPGQFIYIESKTAETFVKTVDDKSSLASHPLHSRKVWMSPDGTEGWLTEPAVNGPEGETLSLPDEQGNPRVADLNGPSYDYLTKLTTDPDELLAKIYKETKGQGNSPDQQAFATIGDLLGESYPPAELYPALFKAAEKIPGVVVVNDVEDAVGRPGVAVARLDETSGAREEWIFDKKTHVFLGERSVQVEQHGGEGEDELFKPGTVLFTSAIVKRTVVDEMKQTPSQAG
ncbi:CU044_5270 family protein [Streptomyces sp. NPDC088387]|uniref:CU044_5270 family protein n=1 Tax=Streptomyces sp. NPDC088387 TaxID=3365859 RepID=UPI003822C6A8